MNEYITFINTSSMEFFYNTHPETSDNKNDIRDYKNNVIDQIEDNDKSECKSNYTAEIFYDYEDEVITTKEIDNNNDIIDNTEVNTTALMIASINMLSKQSTFIPPWHNKNISDKSEVEKSEVSNFKKEQ